ncbi:MAG: SPOR domain-containing protein [Candidatus Zixiibacteriota bacterium]
MNGGRVTSERCLVCVIVSVALAVAAIGDVAVAGRRDRRPGSHFDPLGFPGDDSVITNRIAASKPTAVVPPQTRGLMAAEDSVPAAIWQVQFFATTDWSEANDLRERAAAGLADTVTMEFETPYYKVRAGHFADRGEAEALMIRLRAMGYESAWIVRRPDD